MVQQGNGNVGGENFGWEFHAGAARWPGQWHEGNLEVGAGRGEPLGVDLARRELRHHPGNLRARDVVVHPPDERGEGTAAGMQRLYEHTLPLESERRKRTGCRAVMSPNY